MKAEALHLFQFVTLNWSGRRALPPDEGDSRARALSNGEGEATRQFALIGGLLVLAFAGVALGTFMWVDRASAAVQTERLWSAVPHDDGAPGDQCWRIPPEKSAMSS